ncbi:MAG: hypothetical protein NC191_02130 [Muribaculaceae bacterium]|nr:hypothetical protein [Muribaculaceae bacterium]
METLDILALIHNTYGLVIALKDNLLGLDSRHDKRSLTGLISLSETIEQNLYNIKVEVEALINLH